MTRAGSQGPVRLLLIACLCCISGTATSFEGGETLHLLGYVFMQPIDRRRIVIAIAAQPTGSVTDLFLYTSSANLAVTPSLRFVKADLYYETRNYLRIKLIGNDGRVWRTIQFSTSPSVIAPAMINLDNAFGVTHYTANPPLSVRALNSLRTADDCTVRPRTCIEAGGQTLPFPK